MISGRLQNVQTTAGPRDKRAWPFIMGSLMLDTGIDIKGELSKINLSRGVAFVEHTHSPSFLDFHNSNTSPVTRPFKNPPGYTGICNIEHGHGKKKIV